MKIRFDNGPDIIIEPLNQKKTVSLQERSFREQVILAIIQVLWLALLSLSFSMIFSENVSPNIRWLFGAVLLFSLLGGGFLLIKNGQKLSENMRKAERQKSLADDYKTFQQLSGKSFVLSPTTGKGEAKLRIFYVKNNEMDLYVWYSNSVFRFIPTNGDASINFNTGTVYIPRFVPIPEPHKKMSERRE